MSNQENPHIRQLNVRMTQEMYLLGQKRAKERQMKNISELVRHLLMEECKNVSLTSEDFVEISKRVKERENLLNGRS